MESALKKIANEIRTQRLYTFMLADRAFCSGDTHSLRKHEQWLFDLQVLANLYGIKL